MNNISLYISLFSLFFGSGLFFTMYRLIKSIIDKVDAIAFGTKNSLKDRLLQSYIYYEKQGYMPFDDKEVWMDMYTAYHNLGANGVMDKYRDKILDMPESPRD